MARARASLERLETIEKTAGTGGPAQLDAQIRHLVSLENDLEVDLGRVLAGMCEARAWPRLRFAGVGHYAEERLRLSRTAAEDRLRAARGLRCLPILRRAYENGCVGLEAALTAARALGYGPVPPEVERAWVDHAGVATVKRLRDEALALRRSSPGRAVGTGHLDQCRAVTPLDDEQWHAALRRDPGTARRLILERGLVAAGVGTGEHAGAGAGLVADIGGGAGAGADAGPGAGAGAPAHSDATRPLDPDVFLRLRLPHDLAVAFLAAIESARRRLTARAEEVPWDADLDDAGALPSLRVARMFSIRCRRLPAWVGLLSLLEDYAFTWDPPQVRPRRRPDEEIYRRDGWRCTAPGCTSRRNLEEHHIEYRSRGGGDDTANRICLCRFHHQRGEHGGLAACTGSAPIGVLWRLGRPAVATWFRNERRVSVDVSVLGPIGRT